MDLKEAQKLTKSFTLNSKVITPQLSDDWTYRFDTYYNTDDKVLIKSEKLNISTSINMNIQTFFSEYIYNKKILIDGNHLVGEFAFTKYSITMKDKFNEAVEAISLYQNNEPIPNNELMEFGVYLDNKGETFVYLGNMGYMAYKIQEDGEIRLLSKKSKKRYIVKYNNNSIDYGTDLIQKNSSRKFIEFKGLLNSTEKSEFLISLFNYSKLNQGFLLKVDAGNHLNIIHSEYKTYDSSIVKYGDIYGFNYTQPYWNKESESYFAEIDFVRFQEDILTNSVKDLSNYFINKKEHFEFDDDVQINTINIYVEYE